MCDVTAEATLHLSDSQKHMCPLPVPSYMHTWSTMNREISSLDVHVRRTLSKSEEQNDDHTSSTVYYFYLEYPVNIIHVFEGSQKEKLNYALFEIWILAPLNNRQ